MICPVTEKTDGFLGFNQVEKNREERFGCVIYNCRGVVGAWLAGVISCPDNTQRRKKRREKNIFFFQTHSSFLDQNIESSQSKAQDQGKIKKTKQLALLIGQNKINHIKPRIQRYRFFIERVVASSREAWSFFGVAPSLRIRGSSIRLNHCWMPKSSKLTAPQKGGGVVLESSAVSREQVSPHFSFIIIESSHEFLYSYSYSYSCGTLLGLESAGLAHGWICSS